MTHAINQRGVGLIEVLVGLLLLAVGVLGVSRLLAESFIEVADIRARVLAYGLAYSKLEDLRGFDTLEASGQFSFGSIGADRGGHIGDDGAAWAPSGAVEFAEGAFERHWSTRQYYRCSPSGVASETACAGQTFPDFVEVTVTVSWTTRSGERAEIALTSCIAGIEPTLTTWALSRPAPLAALP